MTAIIARLALALPIISAGSLVSTALPTPHVGGSPLAVSAPTDSAPWKGVEAALGRKGSLQPGGVYKFSLPRSDLRVRVGTVTLKPALALGSWLAFRRGADTTQALMMGDLVLLEAEVGPVMRKLQAGGVQQSALHNHVLGESPRVMYLHVMAQGDPVALARAVRAALALTRTPAQAPAVASSEPLGLDTAAVARALGYRGKVSGGVYQVGVPRRDPVRTSGSAAMEIPPAMGTATALNFQPTGAGRAAITGDFVLAADEVNPVIKTLGEHGIAVTALHNHMLTEEPGLFFMHFWAVGDAARLAQGLRAALGQMQVASPTP